MNWLFLAVCHWILRSSPISRLLKLAMEQSRRLLWLSLLHPLLPCLLLCLLPGPRKKRTQRYSTRFSQVMHWLLQPSSHEESVVSFPETCLYGVLGPGNTWPLGRWMTGWKISSQIKVTRWLFASKLVYFNHRNSEQKTGEEEKNDS